ncbi:cbb3-type cytochrome oxidase assembly protein CcoS [Erythrobacter insulae]|uniref:Cbb3-type cytochrome oxidase assembly protein CcoS n=1 Tax=Erythrobacter insulae TaxID=2584124 RepID=A0A547P9P8_9SPHN|nr:cbb3-type cytochrome oxidase assembly protein CcoS [Erythrobacter insulae]TRD10872.1 cbb3-type cytochrome oxidase assembly protein CcoS [Erythrobacter insulae]
MTGLVYLIPIALLMGAAGLAAFFWAMRSGQYEDMEGAATRILIDDETGSGAGFGAGFGDSEGLDSQDIDPV